MSKAPTLCMIFEAVGPYSAIGKVAMAQVRVALEAGWRVTVVAKLLDESLRGRVEWLPLYVPPRGHALQWLTARYFIRRAMGKRRFDVVHGHQPQIADLCDVFQCHFLTRVAYERRCLERRRSPRACIVRAQQQLVLYAEDRCFRNWNPRTRLLFGSEMMRREFDRLYGLPPQHDMLPLPAPPFNPPGERERAAARAELVGGHRGPVVGYLGGVQWRKGYDRLIRAVQAEPELFLLMAGPYSEGYRVPALAGRMRSLGLVSDVDRFLAACDVLAVPSRFEPTGLVAYEAAARGVPVIATEEVGALIELERFDAGARWDGRTGLGALVNLLCRGRAAERLGRSQALAEGLGHPATRDSLLRLYREALDAGDDAPQALPAATLRGGVREFV